MNTPIAGVILAGGKSSRMGGNKALMSYHGERLIDYIANTLKDAQVPVFVSGIITPYICIPDLISDIGPLGGIISSVDYLLTRSIRLAIFVPVDMPCIKAPLLSRLINSWNMQDAIHYHNHPLPLLLHFSPRVIRILGDLKENHIRDRSIKGFVKQLHSYACSVDDAEKIELTNVNTPEEWQKIQEVTANDKY